MLIGSAAVVLAAAGAGAAELAPAEGPCAPMLAAGAQSPSCLPDDGTTRIRLNAAHATSIGTIETFTAMTSQDADALTADRLVASDRRRLGNDHRVLVSGMTARLYDDRISLTTQMGISDFSDHSSGRVKYRDGSALMARLDAKLAATERLRWSVAAEMSDVGDDFFIGQAFADGARLSLPGRQYALSSSLDWRRARFTAAIDDYRSRFGDFASGRVGISRNGVSLNVRSMRGQFDSGEDLSRYSSRTLNHNATLEFDLAAMAPALAMDDRLPAALVPRSAMIAIRRGSSENHFAGTVERFERRGLELNATWETPIGETSLGYWRDRRIGATALGQRDDRMVEMTHIVRRGGWRFGVDASIAANRSTSGDGLDDRNITFGGSVAYESMDGPRLMIQLSQDRGRMESDDLSFLAARRGQQISASLDLTDYLRKRFDRADLRLKIDIRRQLDRSTTAVSSFQQLVDRWTDGFSGGGMLVSFGMKL